MILPCSKHAGLFWETNFFRGVYQWLPCLHDVDTQLRVWTVQAPVPVEGPPVLCNLARVSSGSLNGVLHSQLVQTDTPHRRPVNIGL